VIAAEVANNASEGGAMSILLALGIPGSGTSALLLTAFMLHGFTVGPTLFRDNSVFVYALITSNLLQMFFMWLFAIILAFYVARVVVLPTRILAPCLVVIMAIGVFCLRNIYFDIYILFFFGILGWFLRRSHFAITSFVIGFMLGRGLDGEVSLFASLFGTDFSVFVRRPISAALTVLTLGTLGLQIYRYWKRMHRSGIPLTD